MGLIRAAAGAVGGTMADQWREFFYCEAMDADTLVVKGQKQVGRRSSNTKGSENIISNGSGIAVADGQCMMIVEQGKIVEVCAEPGEFTYSGSKIRLRGKGIVSMKNPQVHGDHYVTVQVQVPRNITPEARRKLREFEQACGIRNSYAG